MVRIRLAAEIAEYRAGHREEMRFGGRPPIKKNDNPITIKTSGDRAHFVRVEPFLEKWTHSK